MEYWLYHYPYRIVVTLPVILLGGVIALAVGLLTIFFKAWKTASDNPVKALRNE